MYLGWTIYQLLCILSLTWVVNTLVRENSKSHLRKSPEEDSRSRFYVNLVQAYINLVKSRFVSPHYTNENLIPRYNVLLSSRLFLNNNMTTNVLPNNNKKLQVNSPRAARGKQAKKVLTFLRYNYWYRFYRKWHKWKQRIIKDPSLLAVLGLVKHPHVKCQTIYNSTGVCYPTEVCVLRGGIPSGQCAAGQLTCCIFPTTCGNVLPQNGSHFTNPGYPNTYNQQDICFVQVPRSHSSICQIRLDFIHFRIRGAPEGDCNNDRFYIVGRNRNNIIPVICGANDGQHVYIEVDDKLGDVLLTIVTTGEGNRLWNMKISHISCFAPYKAPPYCLQYFAGRTGVFQSFNYDGRISIEPGSTGYFNDLQYTICFRKELGFCSISYESADLDSQSENTFDVLNIRQFPGIPTSPTLNPGTAGAGSIDCPHDYLILSKGVRLCGQKLNSLDGGVPNTQNSLVVDESTGPFVVRFETNDKITGAGFKLLYIQRPC